MGEITLVINGKDKGNQKSEFDKNKLKEDISDLTNAGLTLAQATKYLAKKNNLSKNELYNIFSKDK